MLTNIDRTRSIIRTARLVDNERTLLEAMHETQTKCEQADAACTIATAAWVTAHRKLSDDRAQAWLDAQNA